MFRKFLIKFLKSERISKEFKLQKTNLQNKSFNGNQRELPLNEGLCDRLQLKPGKLFVKLHPFLANVHILHPMKTP